MQLYGDDTTIDNFVSKQCKLIYEQAKEQLAKVVNNLLNEGGLTINWSKKFKNKGNLINVM